MTLSVELLDRACISIVDNVRSSKLRLSSNLVLEPSVQDSIWCHEYQSSLCPLKANFVVRYQKGSIVLSELFLQLGFTVSWRLSRTFHLPNFAELFRAACRLADHVRDLESETSDQVGPSKFSTQPLAWPASYILQAKSLYT